MSRTSPLDVFHALTQVCLTGHCLLCRTDLTDTAEGTTATAPTAVDELPDLGRLSLGEGLEIRSMGHEAPQGAGTTGSG